MKTVVGRDVCSRAASPLKWLGFFVDAVDAVAAEEPLFLTMDRP